MTCPDCGAEGEWLADELGERWCCPECGKVWDHVSGAKHAIRRIATELRRRRR